MYFGWKRGVILKSFWKSNPICKESNGFLIFIMVKAYVLENLKRIKFVPFLGIIYSNICEVRNYKDDVISEQAYRYFGGHKPPLQ